MDDICSGVFNIKLTGEESQAQKWKTVIKNSGCNVIIDHEINELQKEPNSNEEASTSNKGGKSELRNYQKELAEKALTGENVIICAPTGSGKTKVATHIILEHLRESNGQERRKVAFLARTVPLALQQYKVLARDLPSEYLVTRLSGRSNNGMKLHFLVDAYDVLVMTPMILYNCLKLKEKQLEHLGVFSLIVFDECHHTHKGEPYNLLMYSYLKTKKNKKTSPGIKLPQIVGLTASIGVEKANKVEEAKKRILEICGNLDVKHICTVVKHKTELEECMPNLNEKTKQLKACDDDIFVKKLHEIMKKLEDQVKENVTKLNNIELKTLASKIPSNKRKLLEYRQWADKVRSEARAEILDQNTDLSVRNLIVIANHLTFYNIALESYDLMDLKDIMDHFPKFKADKDSTSQEIICDQYFEELEKLVSDNRGGTNQNLNILAETIKEHMQEQGHRCIIFVKTRALTEAVSSWLNRSDLTQGNFKAAPFTSSNNTFGQGMSQVEQDKALEGFRNGEIRILVATSVAEEGLDIPECNLVIKYNHVGNEISTVQTKGRSRSKEGVSVLLAMNDILLKEIQNRQRVMLMYEAIESIQAMDEGERIKTIEMHQATVLKEGQMKEMEDENRKKMLKKTPFTMICHLCRKVKIDSSKVRLINGTCRVALDSSLLHQVQLEPYTDGPKEHDEIEYVGNVRCRGTPQEGKRCKGFLGSMIRFNNNPVVAIAAMNYTFVSNDNNGNPENPKQWKNVKYFVPDLIDEDMFRYISEGGDSVDEEVMETANEGEGNLGGGEQKRPELKIDQSAKRLHPTEDVSHVKKQKVENEKGPNDHNNIDETIQQMDEFLESTKDN